MSVSLDEIVAVVLAGGFGTRIRHLLPDLPKPMAPVDGRPFIEWVVRYLAAQGVRNVVISTGYRAEAISRHFESCTVSNLQIQCVTESEPLGTAGGFLNAAAASRRRGAGWLILNGDSLALAPLQGMMAALADPQCSGAILGLAMNDAARYGTLQRTSAGELIGFEEKKPGAGVINAGVYLLRGAMLEMFPKQKPLSFEKEVFPELIARQVRLKVCVVDAPFLDIGTPESLANAEQFIRANRRHFLL